ncbi:MAG: CoA transferase [Planctomycetes bacterium]|nr:CoA transferase [Planctomycetota bacterium]
MMLLEGVRVLEFGHVWSGPYCGQVLADLGAEVIRVESSIHVDVHRRAGPYPDNVPGINRSGVWNAQNRGKLSCRLNLKTPEGLELARRLVAISHVVVENMAPGVMARLGLGHEDLQRINRDLVTVSLTGYGQDGPWRDFPAYGPMLDAVAGMSWAARADDGVPQSVNGWFPDTTAALFGAVAALHGLTRAGHGGYYADIAQLEATVALFPELMALASLDLPDPSGANEVPSGAAFVLPCTGEDEWLSVVVDSEACWSRLQAILGVRSPVPFAEARTTRERLAQLSAARSRDALVGALQDVGVEAAPVLAADDLLQDEVLRARGAFVVVEHAEVGAFETYGPIAGGPDWAPPARALPAPCLGEHDAYVFEALLGLSATETERLKASGVIA